MIADIKLAFTQWRHRRKAMIAFAEFRSFASVDTFTDDEKKILDELLNTPIGLRLLQTLQAEVAQQDFAASVNAARHEPAAGWACGFRACLQAIHALRPPPPNGEQTEEGKNQGLANLEHLMP